MEKTVYPRKANFYETDMMGVVHHSNHIRYFEESRIFFMRNIGCDVMEMEQKGIIIPNVDAYGRYFKPIRFYAVWWLLEKVFLQVLLPVWFINWWQRKILMLECFCPLLYAL